MPDRMSAACPCRKISAWNLWYTCPNKVSRETSTGLQLICQMQFRILTFALALLSAVHATGTTVSLHFPDWEKGHELPDGWVQGGLEQYASDSFKGAAYFNGAGDMLASPVFPDKILSVTVEGGTLSDKTTRVLSFVPVVDGARVTAIDLAQPSTGKFSNQTLDVSELGATKFYIETTSGSGNWAVRTITVVYGEVDPVVPEVKDMGAVKVSGTDVDAFRLSWMPVDGAEGYVVNVWSNGVIGASEGIEILGERFSFIPNRQYAKAWTIDEINQLGDYGNWSGEVFRGYESNGEGDEEHAVVVGTTTEPGWLMSAPLEISGEAEVRLRLTRQTKDDTAPVLVAFVKDGETNFVRSVALGTAIHAFADYRISASNLTQGCRLVLATQTISSGRSFGRVAVSKISVVCGSSAGTTVPMPVVSDEFVKDSSYLFTGARRAVYGYSVAARFLIDEEHVESESVEGMIDMSVPPWFRCWRASDFLPKPGSRTLDLSGLGKVGSRRAWRNGEEGDGLYAFGDTSGGIYVAAYSSSATQYAIFQLTEETGLDPASGLGVLGNGTSGVRLVLPIRLDTELPVERISVSYALSRLTWKSGTKDTTMTFSWMTSDDFDAMQSKGSDWNEEGSGGFKATSDEETRVTRNIEITDRSLRKAKYLFLKWEVPNQTLSAMIGLTDLIVNGSIRKTGFLLSIK